jgi:murein L,D-transpeptidase YcbB/YkuD
VNIPRFDLELARSGSPRVAHAHRGWKAFPSGVQRSDRGGGDQPERPEGIALAGYLPELRKNPKRAPAPRPRLLKGSEENPVEIDPTTVNWNTLKDGDFPYRLRQDPGPENALGRVKFQLTNDFHVYLHDTPARFLFGHLDRGLSHGCIRVESPLDLARLLLDESSQSLLLEALDQPKERHISVKPSVPIHILYLTAWVDDAGALRFSPDVYQFDGPQRNALDRVASRVAGGPASGAKEPTPPAAR